MHLFKFCSGPGWLQGVAGQRLIGQWFAAVVYASPRLAPWPLPVLPAYVRHVPLLPYAVQVIGQDVPGAAGDEPIVGRPNDQVGVGCE